MDTRQSETDPSRTTAANSPHQIFQWRFQRSNNLPRAEVLFWSADCVIKGKDPLLIAHWLHVSTCSVFDGQCLSASLSISLHIPLYNHEQAERRKKTSGLPQHKYLWMHLNNLNYFFHSEDKRRNEKNVDKLRMEAQLGAWIFWGRWRRRDLGVLLPYMIVFVAYFMIINISTVITSFIGAWVV